MLHAALIFAHNRERLVARIGHIGRPHRRAQLPGDDVAREVIGHDRQVMPAPVDDPEIREVRLLHLVDPVA
jgi:hypothetical protein